MKKGITFILTLLLLVMLASCTSQPQEAENESASQGDIIIGVSFRNLQDIFYQNLRDAMQEQADELGVTLVIQEANNDADKQYSQMQDLVTQGVDAIILAPVATSGSSTAIDLAVDAGIPVFSVDNRTDSDNVVSHIATDNYYGGKLAAEYMTTEVLPDGGNIVLITLPTVESCLDRENGFLDYLEENEITNITVLDSLSGKGDSNEAMSVMQDFITKYGEEINAVYTVTDGMGFGVKSAIETADLDIKIVSFTGNPQALAYIAEETCFTATMRQDAGLMGQDCVKNVISYLAGEKLQEEYLIEPVPVDISNVADYQ